VIDPVFAKNLAMVHRLVVAFLLLQAASAGAATLPVDTPVTIAATGDILYGRYAEDKTYLPVPKAPDILGDIAPIISAADIGFCNLENPVVDAPKFVATYKRMTFRAPPAAAKEVHDAGFDVVSLANNHMFNMRAKAVGPTVTNVTAGGLRCGGAGATPADAVRPVLMEVGGRRIAFLFYTVWNNTGGTGFQKEGSVAFYGSEGALEKIAVPAVGAARRDRSAAFGGVSGDGGIG
jgi:poly-gamma-glutamate capsule biosynthesis protein CapA/YwtB (metallophosphatase superfamily)